MKWSVGSSVYCDVTDLIYVYQTTVAEHEYHDSDIYFLLYVFRPFNPIHLHYLYVPRWPGMLTIWASKSAWRMEVLFADTVF